MHLIYVRPTRLGKFPSGRSQVYQPCESQIFNPEDKPWESAKRFDLIDEVAKARGIEVEF